jgi:hypothetical protein
VRNKVDDNKYLLCSCSLSISGDLARHIRCVRNKVEDNKCHSHISFTYIVLGNLGNVVAGIIGCDLALGPNYTSYKIKAAKSKEKNNSL